MLALGIVARLRRNAVSNSGNAASSSRTRAEKSCQVQTVGDLSRQLYCTTRWHVGSPIGRTEP
jgi:hypothetical protein